MANSAHPSRRKLLRQGLAAGALSPLLRIRAAAAAASGLRAVVSSGGKTYEYTAGTAEDLGAFESPIGGFSQGCFRATRKDFPLVVYFRPDAGSDRAEVVFELGQLWGGQPRHLEAYSVSIERDGQPVASVEVPRHFWFSRWRWQSAPRPVVADLDALVKAHLIPPFGASAAAPKPAATAAAAPPPKANIFAAPQLTDKGKALGLGAKPGPSAAPAQTAVYTIMGLAGVQPNMGQTGERDDIGLVTGPQGVYLSTRRDAALAPVIAQAEAAGTVPWHMRDERTGAPIDLDAYPEGSWYPDAGNPNIKVLVSEITVDSAHQPALAYVPYLLTGDPYYLEEMQFASNWNRGGLPPAYRMSVPQVRAVSWSLRTLAQCAKVTPANVPRWLLPQSYWRRHLDRTREWLNTQYVQNPDPLRKEFHTIVELPSRRAEGAESPEGSTYAPWEDEFFANVVGWTVAMGFSEWKPVFQWAIGSTLARTNGKSGWARAYATPYRVNLKTEKNGPLVKNWAEAYALTARVWKFSPADPNRLEGTDLTYLVYSRGALIHALMLGVEDAREPFEWLDGELRRLRYPIAPKWSFGAS